MNAAYGALMTALLWLLGVPNPCCGASSRADALRALRRRYIAAAFPMVLALAVDPGWGSLLWVLALFAVSEPLMGQVIEPMVFGHSTGCRRWR
jgi:predicted PurR-regulated permease PerM